MTPDLLLIGLRAHSWYDWQAQDVAGHLTITATEPANGRTWAIQLTLEKIAQSDLRLINDVYEQALRAFIEANRKSETNPSPP